MYQLITYRAGYDAFSFSPFCIKAAWLLNVAGVVWERQDENDPRKYPHAKLPCLRDGDHLIHDSANIQAFLEGQGADFWGATSARDKALGHALIRMAEEHMYFYIVIDRWMDETGWPHIREAYFSDIPKLLRGPITGKIRKDLRKALSNRGLLRMSKAERAAALDADLQALTTLLTDHDFLLGDQPTLPDYTVGAMLVSMQKGPIDTEQTKRISNDPVMMAYVGRMVAACQ